MPPPHVDELKVAASQVREVVTEALTTLGWAHRSSWRVTVLTIWAIGIIMDATTTTALLAQPGFVEGNPMAAAGMGVVGCVGYVVLSSCLCAAWAILAASPTLGSYAQMISGVAVVLGLGKLAVGSHNLLLWMFGAA